MATRRMVRVTRTVTVTSETAFDNYSTDWKVNGNGRQMTDDEIIDFENRDGEKEELAEALIEELSMVDGDQTDWSVKVEFFDKEE